MLGVDKGTAEEFYSQCLSNAQLLDRSARERAHGGDAIGAVACAWGSDVATMQAVIWERILVASRNPQRQFYQVAEVVVTAVRGDSPDDGPTLESTAEQLVRSARMRSLRAFDGGLAREIDGRWPEVSYLVNLPAFSEVQIEEAVNTRLLGENAADFVDHRRKEAAASMLEAQARRVHGDTEGAIQAGYESDFHSLDAYLVESALAVGDAALMTVVTRWELATHAVAAIAALPRDFVAAMGVVRQAMADALGEADGARLRRTFVAL